jgi:hypothetical protein
VVLPLSGEHGPVSAGTGGKGGGGGREGKRVETHVLLPLEHLNIA